MSERFLTVIIPMKPLHRAKQRLQSVLADGERLALAQEMLVHVLTTVIDSGIADLAAVISPDVNVLDLAADYGFVALFETERGYNEAVEQGIGWAQAVSASDVLVLPSDLPALTPADLNHIAQLSNTPSYVAVIAPDVRGAGTNALLLRPPDLIPPSFGQDSFQRHRELAQAVGVEPRIYRSPSIAHDVDLPADLQVLKEKKLAPVQQ